MADINRPRIDGRRARPERQPGAVLDERALQLLRRMRSGRGDLRSELIAAFLVGIEAEAAAEYGPWVDCFEKFGDEKT